MSETRWFSVSERLPEDGQQCIIYESGHGCLGPIAWRESDKMWLDLFATYEAGMLYEPKTETGGQVTHWSALPDAAASRTEEKK